MTLFDVELPWRDAIGGLVAWALVIALVVLMLGSAR